MDNFNYFIFARAIHVLGIVLWIGGVAFVTTVLLPAIIKLEDDELRSELFEKLENRFALEAKVVTLITGLSGFYLVYLMDAWGRYLQISYWWMHLMTFVWAIFTLVLFVLEPLVLHRLFKEQAAKNSVATFVWVYRLHVILLLLSLIAVFGAVAGSHGFQF